MKSTLSLCAALLLVLGGSEAEGSITETHDFTSLNLAVPDGNPAGLVNTRTVVSNISSIESVEVSLSLTGTFNGDLYAYLVHEFGFAVLLNRPGSTAASAFGYNDDGIIVTLSASAVNGDIHVYQNSTVPVPGTPLTGVWQPDGRDVDPNGVTDLSPRTAMLSSFNTGGGSGDWTLFVADLSGGDLHVLSDWGLTLTGLPVPEPGVAGVLVAAGAASLLRRRRRHPGVRGLVPAFPGEAC